MAINQHKNKIVKNAPTPEHREISLGLREGESQQAGGQIGSPENVVQEPRAGRELAAVKLSVRSEARVKPESHWATLAEARRGG